MCTANWWRSRSWSRLRANRDALAPLPSAESLREQLTTPIDPHLDATVAQGPGQKRKAPPPGHRCAGIRPPSIDSSRRIAKQQVNPPLNDLYSSARVAPRGRSSGRGERAGAIGLGRGAGRPRPERRRAGRERRPAAGVGGNGKGGEAPHACTGLSRQRGTRALSCRRRRARPGSRRRGSWSKVPGKRRE